MPEASDLSLRERLTAVLRTRWQDRRVRWGVWGAAALIALGAVGPRYLLPRSVRARWDYQDDLEAVYRGDPGSAEQLRSFLKTDAAEPYRKEGTLVLARSALLAASRSLDVSQLQAAREILEEAIIRGADPAQTAALSHHLGTVFMDAGRPAVARDLLVEAPVLDPGYPARYPAFHRDLARVYLGLPQPDRGRALESVNRYLGAILASQDLALAVLAKIARDQDLPALERWLRRLMVETDEGAGYRYAERQPGAPPGTGLDAYWGEALGEARRLAQAGSWGEVRDRLEVAARERYAARVYYERGRLLYEVGDFERAREDMESFLARLPGGEGGMGALDWDRVLNRNLNDPRIPQALYLVGRCRYELGRYRPALDAFAPLAKDIRRELPQRLALLFSGEAYRRMGEWDQAAKLWGWARDLTEDAWIEFAAGARMAEAKAVGVHRAETLGETRRRVAQAVDACLGSLELDGDFPVEGHDKAWLESVRRDLVRGAVPKASTDLVPVEHEPGSRRTAIGEDYIGGLLPLAAQLRDSGEPLRAAAIYEALADYPRQSGARDGYLFEVRDILRAQADRAMAEDRLEEARRNVVAGADALLSIRSRGIPTVRWNEARYRAALDLHEFGLHAEAVQVLRGFLVGVQDQARESQVRYYLARSLADMGLVAQAVSEHDMNMQRFPDGPYRDRARVEAAELLAGEGERLAYVPGRDDASAVEGETMLAAARDRFRSVIEDPDLSPRSRWWQRGLVGLALVLDRIGTRDDALRYLKLGLEYYREDAADESEGYGGRRLYLLEYRLGLRAQSEGRNAEAQAWFDAAAGHAPEGAAGEPLRMWALYQAADARYAQGDFRAALGAYQATSNAYYQRGSTVWAYYQMGHCHSRLGGGRDAVAAFRRAREILEHLPEEELDRTPAGLDRGAWRDLLAWAEAGAAGTSGEAMR